MSYILPLVQNAQLVDSQGQFTTQFKTYLDSLLQRVGGTTGGTYTSLIETGGIVSWDLNAAPVAVIILANGVNHLGVPTNQVAGLLYRITFVQPPSGAAGTIVWPKPPMLFPGGVAPALSTGNNDIDEFWFSCDGTNMKLCVEALNLS